MKILHLLLILSLIACKQNSHQSEKKDAKPIATDTVAIIYDAKLNSTIATNAFTQIDTSGILMFPLTHEEATYDRSSFSSGGREGNSWNIIFYNSKTGRSHLLSDSLKMLIWNYAVENDNSSSGSSEISYTSTDVRVTDGIIFYRITVKDYNTDNTLSNADPIYLFASDKEGHNLRQISPSNSNLLSYEYIKASGKVLMNVEKDTNRDNLFSEKDERTWYETKMGDYEAVPHEVFTENFRNKMKLLFHKQWVKQE
jgi:hypothetical protein